MYEFQQKNRKSGNGSHMKFFIHIGKAKTGSTAFQTGLFSNQDFLKSKGVLYPKSGLVGERHHQAFLASGKEKLHILHPWHKNQYDGKTVQENVDDLIKEVEASDCDKIILSNEWYRTNGIVRLSLTKLWKALSANLPSMGTLSP